MFSSVFVSHVVRHTNSQAMRVQTCYLKLWNGINAICREHSTHNKDEYIILTTQVYNMILLVLWQCQQFNLCRMSFLFMYGQYAVQWEKKPCTQKLNLKTRHVATLDIGMERLWWYYWIRSTFLFHPFNDTMATCCFWHDRQRTNDYKYSRWFVLDKFNKVTSPKA